MTAPRFATPIRQRQAHRRRRITEAYLGGQSLREVARRFGIERNSLAVSLARWGVRLPAEERRRRQAASATAIGSARRGRPPVWPDCPEQLRDEYALLCTVMRAAEARATLERRA